MSADAGELGAGLAALLRMPAEIAGLRATISELRDEVAALRSALPPSLVSVNDAAERLGVSAPTVRRLIRKGTIRSVRVGSSIRVDLTSMKPPSEMDIARLARQARDGRG